MRNKEDRRIKNTKAIPETKKSCITWKTYAKQIYKVQNHIYYLWGWGRGVAKISRELSEKMLAKRT